MCVPLKREACTDTRAAHSCMHAPASDVSLHFSFEGPKSLSSILRSFSLFTELKIFQAWFPETRSEKKSNRSLLNLAFLMF